MVSSDACKGVFLAGVGVGWTPRQGIGSHDLRYRRLLLTLASAGESLICILDEGIHTPLHARSKYHT